MNERSQAHKQSKQCGASKCPSTYIYTLGCFEPLCSRVRPTSYFKNEAYLRNVDASLRGDKSNLVVFRLTSWKFKDSSFPWQEESFVKRENGKSRGCPFKIRCEISCSHCYGLFNTAVTPRNTGCQGTSKFHLLLVDFCYRQYRK